MPLVLIPFLGFLHCHEIRHFPQPIRRGVWSCYSAIAVTTFPSLADLPSMTLERRMKVLRNTIPSPIRTGRPIDTSSTHDGISIAGIGRICEELKGIP